MDQEQVRLRIDVNGTVACIEVGGEIDDATVDRLNAAVARLCDPPVRRIDMDLSGVDYLGSAGIRALVGAVDNRAGVDVRLVNASPIVIRVLELTGMVERLMGTAGPVGPDGIGHG